MENPCEVTILHMYFSHKVQAYEPNWVHFEKNGFQPRFLKKRTGLMGKIH